MPNPILAPIAIAGAGTFVSWFFQRQSNKFSREQKSRDAELKRANDKLTEISSLMDTFAYYNREVVYALVLRPGVGAEKKARWTEYDNKSWEQYVDVQEKWNLGHSRNLAETNKIFGAAARSMLTVVQQAFTTMQANVQATFFDRESSEFYLLNEDGGNVESKVEREKYPRYNAYLEQWGETSKRIVSLTELMLESIQREQIPMLAAV